MENTQSKTVELYNRDSEYYWNVDEFLKHFGYKNVQEYCAYERDTVGTKEYCNTIVSNAMYQQLEDDLEFISEMTLDYLDKHYYVTVKPISERWDGTYKGELQNINSIYDVFAYDVKSITIEGNCLKVVTSHHDGNNTYDLYFSDYKLYENESENDYMEHVINLYDLWYNGDI